MCAYGSVVSDSVTLDCSPPGSSAHGIFWVRILEWDAISYSRGSSWPRDQTCISCTGTWVLCHWATWEACWRGLPFPSPVDLPNQGLNPCLMSPALPGGFFTTIATWEAPLSPRKKQNLFTMALFFQKILSCNNNIRRSVMSNPMDYIACQAPVSMGILLGRILKWVAYRFSRGSAWPRNRTRVSCIAGDSLLAELPGKPTQIMSHCSIPYICPSLSWIPQWLSR